MLTTPKMLRRFWKNVKFTPTCWIWEGKKTNGYGIFRMDEISSKTAHRFSWELIRKQRIPYNFVLRHQCDTPSCIRPSHLIPGTQKENMQDAKDRNRIARGERTRSGKLTEKQIILIRLMRSSAKFTHRQIARCFNVSHNSIGCILRKQTWGHV